MQRKFCLSALKDFGVGKSSFEDNIAAEVACVLEEIQAFQEQPFNPTHLFCNAVSNVTCSVTFGRRFEYSDQRFQKMMTFISRALELIGSGGTLQFLPITQKLTFLPIHKEFQSCMGAVIDFIREEVESHRRDLDPDNRKDLIDAYLSEIERGKDVDKTPINTENMIVTACELFLAGTETTSSSLRWAVLFMMAYPDVQAKVQRELDDVVGRNRLPHLSDRPNLPYTEATILELQRSKVIAPLPLPHRATQDTELLGYHIPKDTIVVANRFMLCRDETAWENPDKFDPSRFLKDGELSTLRDEVLFFGVGSYSSSLPPCFTVPTFTTRFTPKWTQSIYFND